MSDRLERLYEISKCLATFEGLDETFPRILTLVAQAFPLMSAILIEKRKGVAHTTMWPTSGLDPEHVKRAVEHARTAYLYLVESTPSNRANVRTDPVHTVQLQGEEFKKQFGEKGRDEFLVLPVVVINFPVFGVLQLEGSRTLNEDDLKFANALANLIAVALDRSRLAEDERASHLREKAEGSARLTRSQGQITELEIERDLRERFVSTLTHDLRTPLTAAKMNAQMILKQAENAETSRKMAGRIVREINRVDQMIADLLNVNRLRAGEKLPLEIIQCDLCAMAAEAVAMLTTVHGDRFTLTTEKEKILGYWSCDGLRRVIENLANNAVKYGYADRPISISLKVRDQKVLIAVHNEGEPISAEDQVGLFQQFTRTRSAQLGGQRGWGLGLALVQGVADAHGGSVWIESGPDKGTTFIVELPRDARLSR